MRKKIDPTGSHPEMGKRQHLQVYEECFAHLVGKEIRLLELGLYQGQSLLLYRDYFEKGRIVGLDANPVAIDDPTGRIRVYVGYQQDVALLDRIAREEAPDGFDVIIDDCSHIAEPTRISFRHLFANHLKAGGIYGIEDICTAYMDDWVDGAHYRAPHLAVQSLATSHAIPPGARAHTTEPLPGSVTVRGYRSQMPSFRRLLPPSIVQSFAQSQRFRTLYTRVGNFTSPYRHRRTTRSHMYGMVGFAKELVDICARGDDINGALIQRLQVSLNQLLITKSESRRDCGNDS